MNNLAEQQSPDLLANSDSLLDSLTKIAHQAGEVILEIYAQGDGVEVQIKDDSSPVTAADQAAEKVILAALAELSPEIPVVAEEAAAAGHIPDVSAGRFWLVDPLDGTKEFISRNGEFTVNIALVEDGQPIAGVVYAPAKGRTWVGACLPGQAATARFSEKDAQPAPIQTREIPESGAVVVASRRHGSGEELDTFLADYKVDEMISAGSSLKFCLVAKADADLYPRFGRTMEWDTAAGHAVLRAAGGAVMAQDGTPLRYGKPGFENPHFYALGKS
ncbi:MAG: 3'(2'),5'-bisphosphate nucleotidase CysQ [Pseudomonadota bacterium]